MTANNTVTRNYYVHGGEAYCQNVDCPQRGFLWPDNKLEKIDNLLYCKNCANKIRKEQNV